MKKNKKKGLKKVVSNSSNICHNYDPEETENGLDIGTVSMRFFDDAKKEAIDVITDPRSKILNRFETRNMSNEEFDDYVDHMAHAAAWKATDHFMEATRRAILATMELNLEQIDHFIDSGCIDFKPRSIG